MGHPTKGIVAQPLSDTALFAYLAFKFEDRKLREYTQWAERLGVDVGKTAVRDAPSTAARLEESPDRARAVRPWVNVNWLELNFFVALVRLRTSDPLGVINLLEGVAGVVTVCRMASPGELVVTVVYERRSDREALRRRFADLGDLLGWDEVEEQRSDAAASTARTFAREAAAREHLES